MSEVKRRSCLMMDDLQSGAQTIEYYLASDYDALSADLDAAIAERDAAFAQVDALSRFAVGMLDLCPHTDCEGVQELALQQGVLVEVTVTEPCDPEQCSCAEYGDFPMQCYRLSPSLATGEKS